MRLFLIQIAILLISLQVRADGPSLCDFIESANCSGVTKQGRRSSNVSLPSPSTSANTNPANVSFDRGLGVETIYQPGNKLVYNLVTGSGKLGGALISPSLDNAFFGNRVIELDADHFERQEDDKQYDSKKLNLAIGGKLTRQKHLSLDAGFIFKRNSEIKKINPGLGISGRLGPIYIGAAAYYDDVFLNLAGHVNPRTGQNYTSIYDSDTYSEKFLVRSYSIGTKIKNFAIDTGVIQTRYKFYDNEESKIVLLSGSFFYKDWMLNYAIRNETSPALKYIEGELLDKKYANENFMGVQYSFGKKFIFGLNYNYFLLRETSFLATLFI